MLWIGQKGEEERHITFAQFAERSSRAANAFATLGIKKGDRVLVMLPRIPEWWESVLGLMKLGAIAIPCTTLLTPKDIAFRAEVAEAAADLMQGCLRISEIGNSKVLSDIATGAMLASSAGAGAAWMVRINLQSLKDLELVTTLGERLSKALDSITSSSQQVTSIVGGRT